MPIDSRKWLEDTNWSAETLLMTREQLIAGLDAHAAAVLEAAAAHPDIVDDLDASAVLREMAAELKEKK